MGKVAALLLLLPLLCATADNAEHRTLMELKYSLDPQGEVLSSWTESGNPCGGEFFGIGCNQAGRVTNISLQGKGLSGSLSPAISELRSLSGVFLHYNSLTGEIPPEISKLTVLTDLYLNVNNLSGGIPPEMGNMAALQVLQLGYNQLTGSIPTQLGLLKNLSALALQSNQLTGAIPASLGDLTQLSRLDLSYNQLFGSIPGRLAQVSGLFVLDLRSNSLSGNVPSALKKLGLGFRYENNKDLCGVDFDTLRACGSTDLSDPVRPEPYSKGIPQSANIKPRCNGDRCSIPTRSSPFPVIGGVIAAAVAVAVAAGAAFAWHLRRKNTPSPALPSSQKETCRKSAASPLISLEYSNGWDPLSDGRSGGGFSQEVSQSFRFNLEEVESATQYFSDVNLLGKSGFAATFKGILRDGSVVAVKSISKNSCRSEEAEFLKGLKLLTSLDHENLVSLRGFCCSRGRGECFLVYDFVANGSLAQYLDSDDFSLDWPQRVAIVKGIARGIDYLHTSKGLVHQNISARKILIDHHFKPLISGSGLQKLLADDVVFSSLKASAAMGYLAPEYTTTGRFTEKSDVYAFGVLLLQILNGKRKVNHLRFGVDSVKIEDLIDGKLEGNYSKQEAAKLVGIALFCTSENIEQRPTMAEVLLELGAAIG